MAVSATPTYFAGWGHDEAEAGWENISQHKRQTPSFCGANDIGAAVSGRTATQLTRATHLSGLGERFPLALSLQPQQSNLLRLGAAIDLREVLGCHRNVPVGGRRRLGGVLRALGACRLGRRHSRLFPFRVECVSGGGEESARAKRPTDDGLRRWRESRSADKRDASGPDRQTHGKALIRRYIDVVVRLSELELSWSIAGDGSSQASLVRNAEAKDEHGRRRAAVRHPRGTALLLTRCLALRSSLEAFS